MVQTPIGPEDKPLTPARHHGLIRLPPLLSIDRPSIDKACAKRMTGKIAVLFATAAMGLEADRKRQGSIWTQAEACSGLRDSGW